MRSRFPEPEAPGDGIGHDRAMSETPTPSPGPGWYADPESPRNLRYWDGAAWQQQWQHAGTSASTRVPRPVGPGFFRLGGAVQYGLRLLGVVLGIRFTLDLWGLTMFADAIQSGDVGSLERYDDIDIVTSITGVVLIVVIGICWARWQYLLARAATPAELTRGPGWHAGAWFVPVVSFWFPFQNVRDLWRRRFPHRSHDLLGWWWAGWIGMQILDRVYGAMGAEADSVGDFEAMAVAGLVSAAVSLAALVLALVIVRDLTDGERLAGQVSRGVPPVG